MVLEDVLFFLEQKACFYLINRQIDTQYSVYYLIMFNFVLKFIFHHLKPESFDRVSNFVKSFGNFRKLKFQLELKLKDK